MKTNDEIRRDNLLIAIKRMRTATALAEKAEVSAAYLSQVKNQTPESKTGKPKSMGDDVARKIEVALGEPEGWMDADHKSSIDDAAISVAKGRLIAAPGKGLKHTINENKPTAYGNIERVAVGHREIPVISYVQAGMMTEALDPFSLGEGFETITVDVPCSEHTFALRIKGRSMLPRFDPGDVVVIDPMQAPRPGLFVVAKNTDEEATFKKYKALGVNEYGDAIFELIPLNEDFATLHSVRDHLHIVGVAIEHRKGLLE